MKASPLSRPSAALRQQASLAVNSEVIAKWVLVLPLLVFLAVLVLYPAGYAVYVSFRNISVGSLTSQFIGWQNYLTTINDPGFLDALWFTARFTVIVTTLALILGFGVALLFAHVF